MKSDVVRLVLVVCALGLSGFTVGKRIRAKERANHAAIVEIAPVVDPAARGTTLVDGSSDRVLVVFSDYECGFCRMLEHNLNEWVSSGGGHGVRIIYRHLPLPRHDHAREAAIAAECAARQGKFRSYHAELFRNQEQLGPDSWEEIARKVEIPDDEAFMRCVVEDETGERVTSDELAAQRLSITATPTLVLGSKRMVGAVTPDDLDRLLRDD